jgi:hypothetical protein
MLVYFAYEGGIAQMCVSLRLEVPTTDRFEKLQDRASNVQAE